MSSRKAGGKQMMDQISDGVANASLESADVPWEVPARKSKNKAGNNASNRPWTQQNTVHRAGALPASHGSFGNYGKAPADAWPPTRSVGAGRGNTRPQSSSKAFPINSVGPQPAIAAPLECGWNWNSRAGTGSVQDGMGSNQLYPVEDEVIDIDNESDVVDSDDEMLSDDFDSDAGDQSFESRKQNKLLKAFFLKLDKLTVEKINSPTTKWHCPACQGGPGAVAWYQGLQPLLTHARTKGSKRLKLHRELAELLDEELRRRGTSIVPAGEAFGKWEGLKDSTRDREIIWPPMVVIMNTKLEQDERSDKWIGMGNPELLLDYFSPYGAVKASHSYGPQGHRGMSVLIFESSAMGYLKAKRLHKHFKEQRTDRNGWDHHRVLFNAGGNRQLYGFIAEKQDLDFFNQHAQGKSARSRLKYDMRLYEDMVLRPLKKMYEDNEQLIFYQDKAAKAERHCKALEESFELVSGELRRKDEEVRILRQRSRSHHEQNKEEMDSQEDFFKKQLKNIHDATGSKENSFERRQQEERQKVHAKMEDEIQNLASYRNKDNGEFVGARDKLMKIHVEKRAAMKQRYQEEEVSVKQRYNEEEVELKKQFDAQLNQLVDKFTLHRSP